MRALRVLSVLPALAAMSALAAGCGGSSDKPAAAPSATATSATPSASPSPTGLPKAAFVAAADKLCADVDRKLKAVSDPQSLGQVAAMIDRTQSLESEYMAALRPLVARQPDRAALEAHWLTPSHADFVSFVPLGKQIRQAAVSGK